MHLEQIQQNLELYKKAQLKLKVVVRRLMEDKQDAYYAIVENTEGTYFYAGLYQWDFQLFVDLYREVDGDPVPIHKKVPYMNFMRAFPEFGRRDVWKNSWEESQDMIKKKDEQK